MVFLLSAEVILNYPNALLYFVLSLSLALELSYLPPLLSTFCLWSSSTPVMLSAHFLAVPTQGKQVLWLTLYYPCSFTPSSITGVKTEMVVIACAVFPSPGSDSSAISALLSENSW